MFLNYHIALAFVDISMEGKNGLSFTARLASAGLPMQVIFVTSYKDFALETYELSVVDYLVKPVSQERLHRAVSRAFAHWQVFNAPLLHPLPIQEKPQLMITLLGDVVVSNETGRVKWISRKCAELFAYLVL